MKREAITHSKMKRLCRRLRLPLWQAVGLLESIWHLTARETPQGDIGKLADEDIALAIDYGTDGRDAAALLEALTEVGWIDRDRKHRLVVHDWSGHADDAVHLRLARARQHFVDGQPPKLTRLGGKERKLAEAFYMVCAQPTVPCAHNSDPCARTEVPGLVPLDPSESVRTAGALPEPEPRQSQSPALPEPDPLTARAVSCVTREASSTTSTPPAELGELLPEFLDSDAQQRIWAGCRAIVSDCTPEEIAAAVRQKIRMLGAKTTPGLLIHAVPRMFEGRGRQAFHIQFREDRRRQAQAAAAAEETSRRDLERLAQDPKAPAEDRALAEQILRGAA